MSFIGGPFSSESVTEKTTQEYTDYSNAPAAVEGEGGNTTVTGSESVNIDVDQVDSGVVEQALDAAARQNETADKTVDRSFAFAGGAGMEALDAVDEGRDDTLEFSGGTLQKFMEQTGKQLDKAFKFSGEAVDSAFERTEDATNQAFTFGGEAQQAAARQSEMAQDFSFKTLEELGQSQESAVDAIRSSFSDAFTFGGGAIDRAASIVQENAAQYMASLDNTQDDYTDTVGQFAGAAIDKFTEASATESQQTTEKFLRYGAWILGGVAVIALGPQLVKALK